MRNALKLVARVLPFTCCGLIWAQSQQLPYTTVISAEYSNSLDAVIFATQAPNQVAIFDPAAGKTTGTIALNDSPLALSVAPDGFSAAVLHSTSVSYISLKTQTVVRTYPIVGGSTSFIVLASSWIYVFRDKTPWSIRIADGTNIVSAAPNGAGPHLSPSGNTIYALDTAGISTIAYDVSSGSISGARTKSIDCTPSAGPAPYFAVPSADGQRVYTGCEILTASSDPAKDLQYYSAMGQYCASPFHSGASAEVSFTVTDSLAGKRLACGQTGQGHIFVVDDTYLFTIASLSAPGAQPGLRWLFWNKAGTALYAIAQSSAPGGTGTFALFTYNLSNPPPCVTASSSSVVSVSGSGVVRFIPMTAASDCYYQVISNAAWIESNGVHFFSGDSDPYIVVRANPGGARSGTVTIGSQTITINQDSAPPPSSATALGVNVIGAAYNKSNDTLVFLAGGPPEVHIFDPVTTADRVIPLEWYGYGVSLSPDNSHAAVAHDGFISYINLSTGQVERLIKVPEWLFVVVAAGNGYVYGFGYSNVWSYELATGLLSSTPNTTGGIQNAFLHPNGRSVYASGSLYGSYTSSKWSIAGGVAQLAYPAPFVVFQSMSTDGNRLIGAPNVYQTSDVQSQDFKQIGTLAGPFGSLYGSADDSQKKVTATLGSGVIQTNSDSDFSFIWAAPGGGNALQLFWNSSADHLVIAANSAIYYVTPPSPCQLTVSPGLLSVPTAGGAYEINVSAPKDCSWAVASPGGQNPNLTVLSQVLSGPGSFSVYVNPNMSAFPLTTTIFVDNQPVSFSQSGTAKGAYEGYVEQLDCSGRISGWAADRGRGGVSLAVWIFDGTNYYGPVTANLSRPDVGLLLGDKGLHGFSYQLPASVVGSTKTFRVYFDDATSELPGSGKTFNCPPRYVGFLDSASCSGIAGWAADRERLNVALTVTLWDGATLLGTVIANSSRGDVGAYLGDNGLHGFSMPIPGRYADGVSHRLQVRFEGSSTQFLGSPMTLTCGGVQYVGYIDSASCAAGITGWAADRSRLNVPLTVTLWDGPTQVASTTANGSRGDVGALLGDNGLHAFSLAVPAGSAHSLQVRYEGSATQLPGSPVTLTCGGGANYAGWFDHAGCDALSGWAADKVRLNQSISVDILDGSTLVGTVLASASRGDVGSVLGDNGAHGFSVATPAALKDGKSHSVQVRYAGSTQFLGNSPQAFVCSSSTNYTGWVDSVGCSAISGWAADKNTLNTSISVEIYDGSTLLGTSAASASRSDVGAVLGDNGLHGFNFATPAAVKDGKAHTITVRPAGLSVQLVGAKSLTCP